MWKSGFPLEKLLAKERQEAKTRRGQKVGGSSMGWFAHSGGSPLLVLADHLLGYN